MLTRTFVAAAGGLAMLLGAAPLSALHAQTQDSASRRTWGTNPGVQSPPTKGAPAQTGAPAPTGSPAQTGSASEARNDSAFIREALAGNLLEVNLGDLARQQASDSSVKQFGLRMVTDHSSMQNQWSSLASRNGLTIQPRLDAAQQAQVTRLRQLSGAAFDRAYMNTMVQDHQQDVSTFERQSTSADSPEVRQLASSGLSIIRGHLDMARQIDSTLRGGNVAAANAGNNANNKANNKAGNGNRNGNLSADRDFVTNVAAANLMEVRLGQIAERRAKDPAVKQFAKRMVDAYTDFQNRWTGMAARNGLDVNPGLGKLHQEKVDKLQKASNAEFDRVYMTLVTQHFQALMPYFQKEGSDLNSAAARKLIRDQLPDLRQHLAQARRIDTQVHANVPRSDRGQNEDVSSKR
jgi:putative membrane protein